MLITVSSQHTCFLMQEGDDLEAQETLQHVQYATIFHSMKHSLTLQLAILGVSFSLDREQGIMLKAID